VIRIPYVKLRPHADGGYRPRFEPGPKQRALGFAATDLKHPDGRWFNLEEASIYALTRLAEIKAATAGATPASAPGPRKAPKSVGDLVDAYFTSLEFSELAASTQDSYRQNARAIRWTKQTDADRQNGVAHEPQPLSLAPAAVITKRDVKAFHAELVRTRGKGTARNIIMVLSAAYKWGTSAQGWDDLHDRNPCTQLGLTRNPPRVRIWPVEGVKAVIAAADAAGLPSIGDAVMLALYSTQRQCDVLTLVDQVGAPSVAQRAAEGRVLRFKQRKTGARVAIYTAPDLVARLGAAEKRRAARKIVPLKGELPVVIDERNDRAWTQDAFQKKFVELRRKAAVEHPEILDLTFQDFRDTGITWLGYAGCSVPEVASYSGHKLVTAAQILAHYMDLGEPMAREAAKKQAAWLERKNIRLGGEAAE
jgi:hypothetical protein